MLANTSTRPCGYCLKHVHVLGLQSLLGTWQFKELASARLLWFQAVAVASLVIAWTIGAAVGSGLGQKQARHCCAGEAVVPPAARRTYVF